MTRVKLPKDSPNSFENFEEAKYLTKDYTNSRKHRHSSYPLKHQNSDNIDVKYTPPCHMLHVENLPSNTHGEHLLTFLGGKDKIMNVELSKIDNNDDTKDNGKDNGKSNTKIQAFAKCVNVDIACQVLIEKHGVNYNGCEIKISFATYPHMVSETSNGNRSMHQQTQVFDVVNKENGLPNSLHNGNKDDIDNGNNDHNIYNNYYNNCQTTTTKEIVQNSLCTDHSIDEEEQLQKQDHKNNINNGNNDKNQQSNYNSNDESDSDDNSANSVDNVQDNNNTDTHADDIDNDNNNENQIQNENLIEKKYKDDANNNISHRLLSNHKNDKNHDSIECEKSLPNGIFYHHSHQLGGQQRTYRRKDDKIININKSSHHQQHP